MTRHIDGRAALSRFDSVIADARTALGDAIEAAEEVSGQLAEVRRRQAAAYHELARFQISEADTPEETRELAEVDREVAGLISTHEAYLQALLTDLDRAAGEIAELERQRAAAAEALDSAIAAYEQKVDEVETALEESQDYRGLVSAAAQAEAVSERARAKLQVARDDMREKGEVFRNDPLFMYLWQRRFRTVDYKAGNLTRLLDGWVAGLSNYDKSYRNYERLVELPDWLEGHVTAMEAKEAGAEAALAAHEAAALEAAGANALRQKADAERARLEALDAQIERAEVVHLEVAARQSAAQKGEAGPAAEARARLARLLARRPIPDLRVLATRTLSPDDDALVDTLVGLRRDEMALELRMDSDKALPARRQGDLARLEDFRRAFKAARFDSGYAAFAASALDDVVARLMSGRLEPQEAVRTLSRAMRRSAPRTDPRFGGPQRSQTIGLPDIAVGIGLEILKEMGRSGGRGSGFPMGGSMPRGRQTRFPTPSTPRPSPRRSPTPSGGRRGKFKTGGGF